MKKTIEIKGMSCAHCENRVKENLEAIAEVKSAAPSAEKENAVIQLSQEIDESKLKEAVEEAGYEFVKGE